MRALAQGKGIDAAFVAHPTQVEASEILAISKPLSIAAAGEFYSIDLDDLDSTILNQPT